MRLSINRILYEAWKLKPREMVVDWPDDQAYPNSVSLDPKRRVADDEIVYAIRNVVEAHYQGHPTSRAAGLGFV